LGLGAAEFPGTNETVSWDLLRRKRIVGDSDRVRDNRFAFLELLHAAKEYLILSYRARDFQKDEYLQPSSVILELEDYLAGQINPKLADGKGAEEGRFSIRREIPLVLHESLDDMRKCGRGHGSWDKAPRELAAISGAMQERAKHRHDLVSGNIKANVNHQDKNQYTADIKDLKVFFANPLEYHLSRTLGIREDDEGDMTAADEPLASGNIFLTPIRKKLWIAILKMIFTDAGATSDRPPSDINRYAVDEANRLYDEHINSGHAPEGHACRAERADLVKWAEACATVTLKKMMNDFPNHQLVEKDEFSVTCDTFTINGYHPLTLIPKDGQDKTSRIGILSFDRDGKPDDNHELWLEGTMQWICEIRNDDARPISLVALNHTKPDIQLSDMHMDRSDKLSDIEKSLHEIMAQMLIEKRSEHLPFKVVNDIVRIKRGEQETSLDERLQRLTSATLKAECDGYKTYTQGLDLADARPPKMSDGELRELVKSRYAPILGRWIHE
jgi:hypothetical protein